LETHVYTVRRPTERRGEGRAPARRSKKPTARRKLTLILLLLFIGLAVVQTVWGNPFDFLIHRTPDYDNMDPVGDAYGVPVFEAIVPEDAPGRPGEKREIQYVVIHETGNFDRGADAKAHANLLTEGSGGQTSWHYTVDDHEIFHHLPDGEIAWHAGDQRTENGGNTCGIGVELCVNEDGDFEATFENGAKLTASLLHRYGLSIEAVKQHHDFSGKNCPQNIRESDRWDEFLSLVQSYLDQ